MNFGVRLPGPFRAGISSSGHVNAGVTLGPLSASTNVGNVRRAPAPTEIFAPVALLDALADLTEAGWRIDGRGDDWALVGKGLTALQLEAVRGGTVARRVTSRRKVLLWIAVVAAVVVGLAIAGG